MTLLLAAALVFGGIDDGWVTWRTGASNDLGNWCCVSWSAGKATSRTCSLEGGGLSIIRDDPAFQPTGQIQIYAKLKDGRATRIRSLSPQCPVESVGAVTDLGVVETEDSLTWLHAQIGADRDLTSNALLAISTHADPKAIRMLIGTIENRQLSNKMREEALFWLVNSGADEAYAYLDRLLSSR